MVQARDACSGCSFFLGSKLHLGPHLSPKLSFPQDFKSPPLSFDNRQQTKKQSMTSKQRNRKAKAISTAAFDAKFDAGEDISEHLDPGGLRVLAPGEENLDLTPTKVNVDFPRWMGRIRSSGRCIMGSRS